jgi:Uma2 family endonuclease
MAIHSPSRKLTYEDFVLIPEDCQRHEILDGAHVVTAAPTRWHQRLIGRLHVEIQNFLDETDLGELYLSPFDVLLSEHDIVEPDLLFYRSERLGLLSDRYAQGAPDLVIEILSPSSRRRDLGTKRARYELLGVGEYWAFDTDAKTTLVFRRDGDHFLPPVRLSAEADDRLTTPLLPGLVISLRKMFPV